MIERNGNIVVATPETELRLSDEVAVIGEPIDLQNLSEGTFCIIEKNEEDPIEE